MQRIMGTIFGFCFASTVALAGWNSGGGSAVVCRNAANEITQAHLLDVFEGRERFGYEIPSMTSDPMAQVETALQRIAADPARYSLAKTFVENIYANRIMLPPHLALHTSSDLGAQYAVLILDGCRLEQVGYYETDGKVRIARSVFERLSPTDQAAFFLHEALYRMTRLVEGATDSATARKLTAEFLSSSISNSQLAENVNLTFATMTNNVLIAMEPGKKLTVNLSDGLGTFLVVAYDLDGNAIAKGIIDNDAETPLPEFPTDGLFRVVVTCLVPNRNFPRPQQVTFTYDDRDIYQIKLPQVRKDGVAARVQFFAPR